MTYTLPWMNPEDIKLSEIRQLEKDKQHVGDSTSMRYFEQSNSETESRMVVARGCGREALSECAIV